MDPADLHPLKRQQLGAWYTPPALVEAVVRAALTDMSPASTETVLDPACGDGRFLIEAARQLSSRGVEARLFGVDIDPATASTTRQAFVGRFGAKASVDCADSLARPWGDEHFELVVDNPPFLSQMSAVTSRGGRSAHGGGAYADAAAEFLALATELARPDGGRVGLVLPLSVIATRDAGPIRAGVLSKADLRWFWWSPKPVFDAEVRTCAAVLSRPARSARSGGSTVATVEAAAEAATGEAEIRRSFGPELTEGVPLPAGILTGQVTWSALIRDQLGVPMFPSIGSSGRTIGDLAQVTADFRDEYYGLIGAVGDDVDGPPLITSGLIDAGLCLWGVKSTRFAKQAYSAPRVDLAALTPALAGWARSRLVPKVLVASQTQVIEAVADLEGLWVPGVPVVCR